MDFKMHEYTHAIVGKFSSKCLASDSSVISGAKHEHDFYVRLLKELEVEVIELEIGDEFPSNLTIEDLAVVVHGIALLLKPPKGISEKTIESLKKVLQKDLGHTVIELKDPEAKLHASDVLFTGTEFFVGMSSSNEAGAIAVAEAFPEFPCTPIKMTGGGPLKKYITVAGPNVLCVGSSQISKELIKRMEREATFTYQTLTVPEDEAANCLYVNGTLIHRAIEEVPKSFKVFCEKIDFARRSICFSHLAKSNALLTSCGLLVRNSIV